jgi:hypothetical protein
MHQDRYHDGARPDVNEPPLAAGTGLCNTASDRLIDRDLRGGLQALLDAVATFNRDLEARRPALQRERRRATSPDRRECAGQRLATPSGVDLRAGCGVADHPDGLGCLPGFAALKRSLHE